MLTGKNWLRHKCKNFDNSMKMSIRNEQILTKITERLVSSFRSPITLAIDPPATGIQNITIKYSIIPILPIDGVAVCGKLYLCNLGIPGSCYADAGVKYESPFGHKFVIPLHTVCGDE